MDSPSKRATSVQGGNRDRQALFLLVALSAMAASTMVVEIVIVKFVAFKVFHHFINVIVSTVVLSFAAAGTFLYMRSESDGTTGDAATEDSVKAKVWQSAARDAAIYSISLMASVLIFCWLPIDPYNKELAMFWRLIALPIYFILFSIPFFFGGLCISKIFAESRIRPSRVLLFDLVSAGIAALISPLLIDWIGGYGAIGVAAALGLIGYFAFEQASGKIRVQTASTWSGVFVVILAALLAYPAWAISTYGLDIRSDKGKNLGDLITHEFNGLSRTYWNALARIDVSNVGWSNDKTFFYDFRESKEKLEGRIITVDKGANTRQFVNKGNLKDQKLFGDSILSLPYRSNPSAKDILIIGGGGGIDITMAKYFSIPRVTVLEMNPMTYKHVLLGEGDPDRKLFQPWIESDATTNVNILNKEARHFCSTCQPGSYDVIQATGVDTFTAVASGALAYSDNYLYTQDAIDGYMRLLKPGGVLSLAYCREPVGLALRLFLTYLNALEKMGVADPSKHIVVVGGSIDIDLAVKTTPFTPEELQSIRQWCKETGYAFVFDPERRATEAPGLLKDEGLYAEIAFGDHEKRRQIEDSYVDIITPATDDKPYFYQIFRSESWLFSGNYSHTPMVAVLLIVLFSIVLIVLPMSKIKLKELSANIGGYALFFAICGFAFLFFEVSVVQLFTVFVGGPAYALAVVLVSVLVGYSIGCFIVGKLSIKSSTFLAIGAALFVSNICAFFWLQPAINAMLVLDLPARLAACMAITIFISCLAGLPVPLAMESAKRDHPRELTWFWGINCAFNALGAACFPLISFQIGIKASLAIVAVLYLVANLLFAFFCVKPTAQPAQKEQEPSE